MSAQGIIFVPATVFLHYTYREIQTKSGKLRTWRNNNMKNHLILNNRSSERG